MSKFLPKNIASLHHAYVVEGNRKKTFAELFGFLKKHFGMAPGHADLFIFDVEDLGVDTVGEIISANIRKPVFGKNKCIVVNFGKISHQAQNSLLKTLEEPASGTYIFLVTEASSVLLPTVRSRVHVVEFENVGEDSGEMNGLDEPNAFDAKKEAQFFLKSDKAKRLEIIKKILKEKEDEDIGDGDIQHFVMEIEKQAHAMNVLIVSTGDKDSEKKLKAVSELKPFLIVDEYIRDASSSKKLLLEYLALSLPSFR